MAAPAKKPRKPRKIPIALSATDELFVAEYLKDLNGMAAYRRSRPNGSKITDGTAKVKASQKLAKPHIAELVKKALEERRNRVNLDADRILEEVGRLALSDMRRAFDEHGKLLDPRDWPDDVAAAIASVESAEEGGGKDGRPLVMVRKIRAWDKPSALQLAMRHLGMLVDRKEVSGPGGGPIKSEIDVSMTPAEAYRATLGG